MSDDALLWNHEPPRMAKPRPSERVWSMEKSGRRMDAELRYHGEHGVEIQFFYKAEFYQSRRWNTKAEALAEAEEKRRELEREGWQSASGQSN